MGAFTIQPLKRGEEHLQGRLLEFVRKVEEMWFEGVGKVARRWHPLGSTMSLCSVGKSTWREGDRKVVERCCGSAGKVVGGW